MSTLFLFSGQLKSFLPLRPAYHAKVHTVDMALATLGMKSRLGVKIRAGAVDVQNHGVLIPASSAIWVTLALGGGELI